MPFTMEGGPWLCSRLVNRSTCALLCLLVQSRAFMALTSAQAFSSSPWVYLIQPLQRAVELLEMKDEAGLGA